MVEDEKKLYDVSLFKYHLTLNGQSYLRSGVWREWRLVEYSLFGSHIVWDNLLFICYLDGLFVCLFICYCLWLKPNRWIPRESESNLLPWRVMLNTCIAHNMNIYILRVLPCLAFPRNLLGIGKCLFPSGNSTPTDKLSVPLACLPIASR